MKNSLLILVMLAIPFLSIGQLELYPEGKIKEVKSSCYSLVLSEGEFIKGDSLMPSLHNYHYFYDKEGRALKYIEDGVVTKKKYIYNKRKRMLKIETYVDKKLTTIETNSYDQLDNILKTVVEEPPGSFHYKNIYKYDDANNKIEDRQYVGASTNLTMLIHSEFDSKGNLTKKNRVHYGFHDSYKDTALTKIAYDSINRPVRKESYNNARKTSLEAIKYLNNVSIKETYRFPSQKLVVRSVFILNEQGDAIEWFWTDLQDDPLNHTTSDTYQYIYDDKGNWTVRKNFSNGKPERIVIREISYYE